MIAHGLHTPPGIRSRAVNRLAPIAFVAVLLAVLLPASTQAAARGDCGRSVIEDWRAYGHVDTLYSLECYRRALEHLPVDTGWAYEGFCFEAQDADGQPFLIVFNHWRGPHASGGRWAASRTLFPFAHG